MPDLRFRIVGDDQGTRLLDSFTGRLRESGRVGEKFGREIQAGSQKVDKSLDKVEKQAKDTGAAFKGLGGVIAGVFAGVTAGATLSFLKESLVLLSTQQQAVNDLALAMRNLGVFTEDALNEQVKFAGALQQTTTFGDEQIITLQSLLTSFGLSGDELKKTTEATLDLAVAQRVDLNSAALLLGKAFVGETSSLSRYGIILEKNVPKTEKFTRVLEILNGRFGGAAAQQVDTFSGKVQQLGNSFGDLREAIGELLEEEADGLVAFLAKGVSLTDKFIKFVRQRNKQAKESEALLKSEAGQLALRGAALDRAGQSESNAAKEIQKRLDVLLEAERKAEQQAAAEKKREQEKQAAAAARTKALQEQQVQGAALAETAKQREKAEEDFETLSRELRLERMELAGQEFAVNKERIEFERDEKIKALKEFKQVNDEIDQELVDGAITNAETIAQTRIAALDNTSKEFKVLKGVAKSAADDIASNFASAFADTILEAKTFAEVTQGFFKSTARVAIEELTRIAVRAALTRAALAIFGPTPFIPAGMPGFQHGTQRVPGPVGEPRLVIAHGGEQIGSGVTGTSAVGGGLTPGGGSGANIVQNITQNIQVAQLGPAEREMILGDLAQSFRSGSDSAREFASESQAAAERNAGLST